ncbi:hypothetical protein DNTS_028302 [Danionella cerebrum]|uniref:Uncharacterized protein n=1 Tax=Danionella cerebrum TaxID=2873325 RepID=A0A553NL78_9TELE|nr:hypothetical protein DNTS_028302 [Danionella translucida]
MVDMERKRKKQGRCNAIPALDKSSQIQPQAHLSPFPGKKPLSRKTKESYRKNKCKLLPDIRDPVNSMTGGNYCRNSDFEKTPHLHEQSRDTTTFLSASERARLFGINKWY